MKLKSEIKSIIFDLLGWSLGKILPQFLNQKRLSTRDSICEDHKNKEFEIEKSMPIVIPNALPAGEGYVSRTLFVS